MTPNTATASSFATDRTRPVRPGEELDIDALRAYLRAQLAHPVDDLTIEQFPGGHSNLTYLVRVPGHSAYVLRRPPFSSKVATAHDMGREHRVLSKLAPVFAQAPMPLSFCDDASVLGAPFYLMQRIEGVILRRELPTGLVLEPDIARRMCETLVDTLAALHAVDYQAAGLADLGKPQGYVKRQIEGWNKRYRSSQTDDIPAVERLATWLGEHLPADGAPALIHNDYKFDNVVLDAADLTSIIGILDWEMSTLGDPLMDLGTSLCYWVQADDPSMLAEMRFGPTHVPGMMTRDMVVSRYSERSGRDVSNIVYYYVFGLFKTAVVAQQIYYRFKQGLTQDPRFARMIRGVDVLSQYALAVIARGHL
jgi:aminoglycoside phosphotransferase (APT) family kinase protein